MDEIPSIGRIVHYRLPDGPCAGEYRPAIIVRVWDPSPTPETPVNLQVFTDGSDGDRRHADGIFRVRWVVRGDELGQYRWPPFVPPAARQFRSYQTDLVGIDAMGTIVTPEPATGTSAPVGANESQHQGGAHDDHL